MASWFMQWFNHSSTFSKEEKMVRKTALIALVMVVALVGMANLASAVNNVANTNQKGSLLIFPLVQLAWYEPEGYYEPGETYITIGNDYPGEVWVKCYWVDWDQNIEDFMFRLTPNQPVWFKASDGEGTVSVPPFGAPMGELKCWAVNAEGTEQISWNHLYGSALVVNYYGIYPQGFQYSAYSFAAKPARGAIVGTGGELLLNGVQYDMCPSYLVENFIAQQEGPPEFEPVLTLVPCKQDLRQDRIPTCTKAKFDVWNENETKYTGAWRCLKCWAEFELGEINFDGKGYGADKFLRESLHTWLGRFRVTGQASSVCNGKFDCRSAQVATPFLGVLWHELEVLPGGEIMVGITPHSAGSDDTGKILWDKAGPTPEAPGN
jgi:hypothetical protein